MVRARSSSRFRGCYRKRFLPLVEPLELRGSPTTLLQLGSSLTDAGLMAASPAATTSMPREQPLVRTEPPAAVQVERISEAAPEFPFVSHSWADERAAVVNPFGADAWTTSAPRQRLGFLPNSVGDRSARVQIVTDPAHPPAPLSPTVGQPARTHTDTGRDLLLLASTIPAAPTGPGRTPPVADGFTETVWFRDPANLSLATGMAWAPDGSNRLFITRQSGEVRILQDGQLLETPFATLRPIYTESECGLIGIAFDPNYTVNRHVWFFVTVSDSEQQIIRYTDDNNQGIEKTTVLAGLPTQGINHDGGAIGFGLDGKLYFSIGDLGTYEGADDDLTLLASKVGRANLDGTVPLDNPFYDGDGPNNDYIWARGFRNPFTLTFQPGTGQLWLNVVGKGYEQIFVVNAGEHGGWRQYENTQPEGFLPPVIKYVTNGTDVRTIPAAGGAQRSGGVATITTAEEHGFRRGERITLAGVADGSFDGTFPVLDTPDPTTFRVAQPGPDATSGGGTATTQAYGGAVLGGTFYNGTQFPSNYWGNFFFGDFNSGNLFNAVLDDQNGITQLDPFSTDLGLYIDAETGPDGALYYVNYTGTIYRVSANVTEQNLVLSHRNLDLIEGNQRAFNVSLAQAPATPVTVSVARASGDEDVQIVEGARLTFTPDDWFYPQRVLVAAAEDADTDPDAAVLEVSATGLASQFVNVLVGDNDPVRDEPPTARLSFPSDGDELSGATAEFFGNGYDDRGTQYAEFYVDDQLEWVDLDNPKDPGHYHYGGGHNSWDTTIYANGPHRLRLVVYDTAGQFGSTEEITVLVNN